MWKKMKLYFSSLFIHQLSVEERTKEYEIWKSQHKSQLDGKALNELDLMIDHIVRGNHK